MHPRKYNQLQFMHNIRVGHVEVVFEIGAREQCAKLRKKTSAMCVRRVKSEITHVFLHIFLASSYCAVAELHAKLGCGSIDTPRAELWLRYTTHSAVGGWDWWRWRIRMESSCLLLVMGEGTCICGGLWGDLTVGGHGWGRLLGAWGRGIALVALGRRGRRWRLWNVGRVSGHRVSQRRR